MLRPGDPRNVSLRDSLVGQVLRGAENVAYYLQECIGEGGQGWVFRAHWDDPSGHVVIVKVLRPDVFASEALLRFQREAEVLRRLSTQGHPTPYIVRFFNHAVARVPSPYGPEPLALPFTVLEFVDGRTLETVLAEYRAVGRGMPAARVRRLLRQICLALDAVHKQKIVHRDLKPSNILLASEAGTEIAKVTDFGLVKLVDVNLQKTTALAGASLGYAPPEQYEQGNQRVSPRTDVFSLAAVVFEMLATTAAFPFIDGENPLIVITRILNGPRPSLLKVRAKLSPELGDAALIAALDRELARALSADPLARHESTMDFWAAIEPALRGGDSGDRRPGGVSGFEATERASTSAAGPSDPPGVSVAPPAHASDPGAWSWSVIAPPLANGGLRAAAFTATGDGAIALGNGELVRWERGAWIATSIGPHVPRATLRGLRWMGDGSVLLFGEGGFVARHVLGGATTIWRVPDPEITFLGAIVEPGGLTTLVGERPYRGSTARPFSADTAGVVAQFHNDRVSVVGDALHCARLHAVARLSDGQLVACGDAGAIVRVELGVAEHVASVCEGHLLAIAPTHDGGAITVGVGGHALKLGPKLDANLEPVQTTKSLLSISVTVDGQAWVGSAQARLLRRPPGSAPSGFARMNGESGVNSSMIAIAATPRVVRAIGDDGAVVEGRLA